MRSAIPMHSARAPRSLGSKRAPYPIRHGATPAVPPSGRSATTGRPSRAPRATPTACGWSSSRAPSTDPAPEAEPEQVRANGRRPQEPLEPPQCREDHDDIDIVAARKTFVDAPEPEPTLGWKAIDHPPHGRHAHHDPE